MTRHLLRRSLSLGSAVLALLAATALLPARELRLKSGKLVTMDSNVVESFGDDMNFCFAIRYSDGSIHMNHSKGIHTITEYGCADMSKDNGHTWSCVKDSGTCCGINSWEGLDGQKWQVGCWDLKASVKHTMTVHRYDEETGKKVLDHTFEIEMPYSTCFLMHRDVIRTRDGKRLLATVYGPKEGARKDHSFIVESLDEGQSWHFLSIIAEDPEAKTAEGPDETTLVEMKDGRFLAIYRVDGNDYLRQRISADGGLTWGEETVLKYFKGGASPHARMLKDGTLVMVGGRPNVYLMVDFTGTAEHWESIEVYHGGGSSYASVLETGDNEVLVIYDESFFGGWTSTTAFSHIYANRYKIERYDDSEIIKDPRAKGCQFFLTAEQMDDAIRNKKLIGASTYVSEGKDGVNSVSLRQIPERPYPVLNLVHRGDGSNGGSPHSTIRFLEGVSSGNKLTMRFELRLNDNDQKGPQFAAWGPCGNLNENGQGYMAYLRIGKDKVEILNKDGGYTAASLDVGVATFHTYCLVADAATGKAALYMDDIEEPVLVSDLRPAADSYNFVQFGDGSWSILGSVDLSYFGYGME